MTEKEMERFVKKLKLAMLESGFNQVSLAKKVGLKTAAVSKWITGRGTPSMATLEAISKATNRPINYFFTDDSNTQHIVGNNNNQTNGENFENRLKLLEKEVEVLRAEQKNLSAQIEILRLKK